MPEKPSKRLFVDLPSGLLESELPMQWPLESMELIHYLTQVVRVKPNEPLFLVDLHQSIGVEAIVYSIAKRHVVLELIHRIQPPTKKQPHIVLAASLIKENRWDWMLQKATELGVSEIVPLLSEHVSFPLNLDWSKKHDRWFQIVKAASEQSERWTLPKIKPVTKLSDWLKEFQSAPHTGFHRVFGFERDEIIQIHSGSKKVIRLPLKQYMANYSLSLSKEWLAVIGPEGGWTKMEVAELASHHFQPVGMGTNILRAETAAIQMMGILNYELGL